MGDLARKQELCYLCIKLHDHGCSILTKFDVIVSNLFSSKNIEARNVVACNIDTCEYNEPLTFIRH